MTILRRNVAAIYILLKITLKGEDRKYIFSDCGGHSQIKQWPDLDHRKGFVDLTRYAILIPLRVDSFDMLSEIVSNRPIGSIMQGYGDESRFRYCQIGCNLKELGKNKLNHLACLLARLRRYIHPHICAYAPADVPCRRTKIRRNLGPINFCQIPNM